VPGLFKPALLPGVVMLAALVVLTGCDKPSAQTRGRWAVIPASALLESGGGIDRFSAWRLDTETGDLELCQYASRPVNGSPSESLKCSEPVKGPSSSVRLDMDDNSGP
jgi:hypothetical protein